MKKIMLILMLLVFLTVLAFSGAIVVGFCDECGYKTDDLFIGRGFTPGYNKIVYYSPDLNEYMVVTFDLIQKFCLDNGLDLKYIKDYDSLMNDYPDEYEQFELDWMPPDEIETDAIPNWIIINIESDKDMPSTLRLCEGDVWEDDFKCPGCGKTSLDFERVGFWD
jgi:hypothetical protein